jgi:PAS domain S-box-containing protein
MENQPFLLAESGILLPVFEQSPAAILLVGKGSSIQLVNKEAERITGYSKQELEGQRKWTDLVLAEDKEDYKNLMRMLKAGDNALPEQTEIRFVDRAGEVKTVNISGIYHPDSSLTVLFLINISDQKENELNLQQAREKAEASDRLKTAFLGNLSHEIRTPMNAIVGFASLLQMEELAEEKKQLYLSQIVSGSSDLLQLIEKTIILSRIDLGQLKINRRQFFVNKDLLDLRDKYEKILHDAGKEDVDLELELGKKEEDFVIQADRIRVLDILNNLLENAAKFTQTGKIFLGYAYLEEESDNGEDALLFYVKDTGCGIQKDKTTIIFDRFVKIVDKNETVLRGAGLGLAISRELARLMGGNLWVESTPGEGSRFFFTLPISYSKTRESSGVEKRSGRHYDDWSDYTLMIAEDIESNYLYIKELLSPSKITILRARDGLEAVEIFEKHPDIHVVLMDILMPGLDGYEATHKIREIRSGIPVIAQTAFTFEGEILNGLYAGCFNDYIMKPFTRDMLMAHLKKYLVRVPQKDRT